MKRLILLNTMILLLVGCNAGPNQTNIELIQNMMDQPSIKSQDWDPNNPDQVQMRQPPAGTVARGKAPYKFQNDPEGGEKEANPLAGNMSPEVLTLGRQKYDIFCAVCHGPGGNNDGTVSDKMPVKPRLLLSDEARGYSDGRIYFAITAGRGVMGSYAGQIPNARDRWAVVNYVRSLQKQTK